MRYHVEWPERDEGGSPVSRIKRYALIAHAKHSMGSIDKWPPPASGGASAIRNQGRCATATG